MKNHTPVERLFLIDTLLHKFPVHYQAQMLDKNNELLLQYNMFSLGEIITKLNLFTNKKPCGFEHDRIFQPLLYPDGLSEQDLLLGIDAQIGQGKDSRVIRILNFNNIHGFNSNSCKHKIHNTNCGHPELTGLLQLIVVSIAWIMSSGIDFDVQKTIATLNIMTDFDANYGSNFKGMELDVIKQRQSDTGVLILLIIDKITLSLNGIKLDT